MPGRHMLLTYIYSHTYKSISGDLHVYNIPLSDLFTKGEIKSLFLSLIISQKAFHQPFGKCLAIGIHHQSPLVKCILDIAQLYENRSRRSMRKHVQIASAHRSGKATIRLVLAIF